MCSTKFSSRVEKNSIIWKIWDFHPGLKFHLGLAKPCWNFSSVYRVEIFTWNCNVISKRCFLFNWDEFSTRYTEWKFQPGLKSPYNQPLSHFCYTRHYGSCFSVVTIHSIFTLNVNWKSKILQWQHFDFSNLLLVSSEPDISDSD